jgi:ubiquinone/menaquinone biosynthesis C-methylase UbiE
MSQTSLATPGDAKAKVEALFDSLAPEYVRERERQFSFLSQKRIVMELLRGQRGRLLEVGCGPGAMLPDLLAMGFEVHGIDVSAEMIRSAEQRIAAHALASRCRLRIGDVERLRYSDASFDAVLSMGVLEYLPNHATALHEIARVLKPGGQLVLTVPNQASAYHMARVGYLTCRRLLGAPRASDIARPRLPWALDRALARAGLRKVESRACNFIFFPLKDLHERVSDALNRALTPLSGTSVAPFLGAQYIVKAQKSVWASASYA